MMEYGLKDDNRLFMEEFSKQLLPYLIHYPIPENPSKK